jgi:hypothetical protein
MFNPLWYLLAVPEDGNFVGTVFLVYSLQLLLLRTATSANL